MDNASGNVSKMPSGLRRAPVSQVHQRQPEPAPGHPDAGPGLASIPHLQPREPFTGLSLPYQDDLQTEGTPLPRDISEGVPSLPPLPPPPPRAMPVTAHSSLVPTLDLEARLISPTPINSDPPPLMDVPPLSHPVRQPIPLRSPSSPSSPGLPNPGIYAPDLAANDPDPLMEPAPALVGIDPGAPDLAGDPLLESVGEPPLHYVAERDLARLPALLLSPPSPQDEIAPPVDLAAGVEALPEPAIPDPDPNEIPQPRGAGKTGGYVKNEFFISEGAEDPWILPSTASNKSANLKKRHSGKPSIWNVITTGVFFGSIVLFIVLLSAWMMRGRIAKSIESSIASKIHQAGLFIDYETWEYDPVRGIVLKNLTIYEGPEKVIPHAKADNLGFNTNFFSLIKTGDIHAAPSTLSFKDSAVKLFDQGEPVAELKHLRGDIELALRDCKVEIDHVRGQLEGLRFDVDGKILMPENQQPEVAMNSDPTDPQSSSSSPSSDPLATAPVEVSEVPGNVSIAEAESLVPGIPPPPVNLPGPADSSSAPSEVAIPTVPGVVTEIPATGPIASTAQGGENIRIKLPSNAFFREVTPFAKLKTSGNPPLMTSDLSVDLTKPGQRTVTVSGRLSSDGFTFEDSLLQGVSLHNVDLPFRYDSDSGQTQLTSFTLGYGEGGMLSGSASYHSKDNQVAIKNLRSTIDLVKLASDFDASFKDSLKNVTFLDHPEIFITEGKFPLDDLLAGSLDFSYEQWAGILVNASGKILPIREMRGKFKLDKSLLTASDFKAVVLEGPVTVNGTLQVGDASFPFNGIVKVRDMPLESIAKLSGIDPDAFHGMLNLDYQGSLSKNISELGGSGVVEVQNGGIYKVPVLGPLRHLLGAAIPAFGTQFKSGAFGRFVIESGILTTTDLTVRSDGTKIAIRGQADLARQLTAFSATASLDGALGTATGLSEEVIELEGIGPLTKPQIKLKSGGLPAAFTSEKARQALGIKDGSTEAISAAIQEIAGGTGGLPSVLRGISGNGSARSILDGILRGGR